MFHQEASIETVKMNVNEVLTLFLVLNETIDYVMYVLEATRKCMYILFHDLRWIPIPIRRAVNDVIIGENSFLRQLIDFLISQVLVNQVYVLHVACFYCFVMNSS